MGFFSSSAGVRPADRRLLAGEEIAPSAVGRDADLVEDVAAARQHLLVVRAGDHPEQLDLLGRRQRLDRKPGKVGPDIRLPSASRRRRAPAGSRGSRSGSRESRARRNPDSSPSSTRPDPASGYGRRSACRRSPASARAASPGRRCAPPPECDPASAARPAAAGLDWRKVRLATPPPRPGAPTGLSSFAGGTNWVTAASRPQPAAGWSRCEPWLGQARRRARRARPARFRAAPRARPDQPDACILAGGAGRARNGMACGLGCSESVKSQRITHAAPPRIRHAEGPAGRAQLSRGCSAARQCALSGYSGGYWRVASENSPLRMRTARPSANCAAASSP